MKDMINQRVQLKHLSKLHVYLISNQENDEFIMK